MGWGWINAYGWSVGLHWNLMASAVWERKDHDYKNFGHNIREDGRGENTALLFYDKRLKEKTFHDQCVAETQLRALNDQKKKKSIPVRNRGQQLQLQCLADLNSQGRPAKSEKPSKRNSDPQDLLNLLFERGPDFVLIEAAKSGDEEIVKLLIDNEDVNVNAKDDYGYTALCYAAVKGHSDIVDLLVENDANVNARNSCGGTALVQAVYFGHLQIAKNLINLGADVNVNIHGQSLLSYAEKKGHDELVEHLIANGAIPNAKSIRNTDKTGSRFKKWRLKK